MNSIQDKKDFKLGLKRGIPICLGYLSVSFTFGLLAVNGGIPVWLAIFISLSNLTGAGQFACLSLMIGGTTYIEIALTTLIINLRYTLMSISLSQKVDEKITTLQRMIFGYAITDEVFSVASVEQGAVTFPYMLGLMTLPIVGWVGGTTLGALICSNLPAAVSNAMGIAIYGMFIAIMVPPMKGSKAISLVVVLAVVLHLILYYTPCLSFISSGFRAIIAALIAATIGALLFPQKEEENHE